MLAIKNQQIAIKKWSDVIGEVTGYNPEMMLGDTKSYVLMSVSGYSASKLRDKALEFDPSLEKYLIEQ